MIARVWSAHTTPALAPAYAEHLREHVLPAIREVEGYAGATLLERAAPEGVELLVITYWQSLDSVRGFAGDDLEAAVVAVEAVALLTRLDRRARHFEVAVKDDV